MLVLALGVEARVLLRDVREWAFALAVVLVALGQSLGCALEGLLGEVGSIFWVSVLGLVIVVHQVLQLHIALFGVVELALSLKQDLERLSLSPTRLWIDNSMAILIFLVRVNLRKGLRIHFFIGLTLDLLDNQL